MSKFGKLKDLMAGDAKRCEASGKVCFDKKGAQTAANLHYRNRHEKLRIYQCPYGDHWHLTSRL